MTSIVVLDGHALNPGDLSWQELEALGACRVYPRTAAADIVSRSQGADILLTNKTRIAEETLQHLPAAVTNATLPLSRLMGLMPPQECRPWEPARRAGSDPAPAGPTTAGAVSASSCHPLQ